MFFFTRRRARPFCPFACAIYPLLGRRCLALARHAHPARPLAAPGVGLRTLAPNRQATAVAQAAVGADLGQPLDVLGTLAPQVTLDVQRLDGLADLHDFLLRQ